MTAPATRGGPGTPRPPRSAQRMFAATVLVLEAFVVFFATLAAFGLRAASPAALAIAGLGGATACILAAGLLRTRIGYVAGTIVQVAFVLAGVVVADLRGQLLAVAIAFAVVWAASLVVGRRIDVERQERYRAELAHAARHRGAPDAGRASGPAR